MLKRTNANSVRALILVWPYLTLVCPGLAQNSSSVSSSSGVAGGPRPELVAVFHPNLGSLEKVVREQLVAARAQLDEVAEKPGVTGAELGETYGAMGKLYQAYDMPDAAIASYRNAHILVPKDFRWTYYLGDQYDNKGELPKAISYFEIARQIRPADLPALLRLAEANLEGNQTDVAKPLFEQALRLNPSSAAALFALGKMAQSEGDAVKAVRYFEEALEAQPTASTVYYALAIAHRKLGQLEKARAALEHRGTGRPRYAQPLLDEVQQLRRGKMPHWMGGNQAFHEGRFADAVGHFRKMVEAEPDDPIPRMYLGAALSKAGRPDSAIASYTEALELAPTNARVHYNLGVVLTELRSEQQAIGHYRAAVRFDPSLQRGHFHLANLLMRAKRYEEAVPHYAAVVKEDPQNAFARFMHSVALISAKRYREAFDGLEEGHKAMPDNADFAHALARLLAASPDSTIRDGSRALQLTQKLLENQSSVDFDHAATLAMALAEVGEFSKAVQLQRNMLAEVERAGRHDLARLLRENLRLYENHQACRTPWPEDDPIFSPVQEKPKLIVPEGDG